MRVSEGVGPFAARTKAFNRDDREERLAKDAKRGLKSGTSFAIKGFSCRFLSNCEPVVEHEVDENAGDRDVQPEREGPAGDGAMAIEALAQGSGQRNKYQRHDHYRQNYVRDQDGEVDGTRPSCTLKAYCSNMGVVVKI